MKTKTKTKTTTTKKNQNQSITGFGSQRRYISDHVRKFFGNLGNLETQANEKLSVFTFGSKNVQNKKSE